MKTDHDGLDGGWAGDIAELRDIALFVAVADGGSFTQAARRVGLPTSTLSWRIGDFERRLGIKLFNRTTRRVELTPAGAIYLDRCRRVADDARAVTREMKAEATVPQGRLRVSATADFAIGFLAPLLPAFLDRYPGVTVDLDTSAVIADLTADKLDVAIRIGKLGDSQLVARRLMEAHLNLFASPVYLERFGEPSSPADLRMHHCIKVGPDGGDVQWQLTSDETIADIDVTPRLWTNAMSVARELVLKGLGIAMLVEELYRRDIASGDAVRVLPKWSHQTSTISAVVPARALPAKTRVFVDYLIEAFASGTRASRP